MEEKIQLKHPAGKKLSRIDRTKYDVMRKAITASLKGKQLTHTELTEAVKAHLVKNEVQFEGSVEWYMESVKLDLEANKVIERVATKPLGKYKLAE